MRVHGPKRDRLQQEAGLEGGVRTVHAPHVIKSAEVEELSKAEARNFDPSPTRWSDSNHRLTTTIHPIASIAHAIPQSKELESIV